MAYTSRDERRALLAESTWKIIVEKGVSAVSVRSVAAESSLATGSLRHLFPTQSALLEFSAELMVERATARVSAIEPIPDVVEHAVAVIREVMPFTPESRREFEVSIALIAETPAHPGLAWIRNHAHEQLLDLFVRLATMLRAEGTVTDDARRDGQRLLALADGLGLHLLHQRVDAGTTWAVDIIRDEVSRIRANKLAADGRVIDALQKRAEETSAVPSSTATASAG